MTYDSFNKNIERLYVVYMPSNSQSGFGSRITPYPLAAYLQETFPEIANATTLTPASQERMITVEGVEFPALYMSIDSSFIRMFDLKIQDGNFDFLIPDSRNLSITSEKAKQWFGKEYPIGKTIMLGSNEYTISAVVTGMSKHSNYPFDILQMNSSAFLSNPNLSWNLSAGHTIIELFPGTNVEAFEKKLYEHEIIKERTFSKLRIRPLSKLRYTDPNIKREVKFQYIFIFVLSGLLVVLCSLFNYLTLFVSRSRIRLKELALRVVCGASGGSLSVMLSVEFMLTLLFAVLLGCGLTQIVHKPFLTMSDISMNLPVIYRETLLYIGGVILVCLLVFWLILFVFRKRSLDLSIRRSNKKLFRKTSVVVQLVISIGFAFCAIVMLKQMYFLNHTDELGFSFQNRGSMLVWADNNDVITNKLQQIPEITEVVVIKGLTPLLPSSGRASREIDSWEDKPVSTEKISIETMYDSPEYESFYEFKLVAGELLSDADPETSVLINESAAQAFGWLNPVGKMFDNKYFVKGVIKNVYNYAPTIQIKPVVHILPPSDREIAGRVTYDGGNQVTTYGRYVMFKYREGMWKSCKEKIERLQSEFSIQNIYNTEEAYNDYLKSENALLKLLSFVSAICILICVFGFVSLVSLTCEERRKSIAIRKINGATSGDILVIFAKEYFLLLMIGAVIALSTGFYIMQHWLEQYVKQTNIPAWVYMSILLVMALVIVVCVGWQVYKTSIENPANVINKE